MAGDRRERERTRVGSEYNMKDAKRGNRSGYQDEPSQNELEPIKLGPRLSEGAGSVLRRHILEGRFLPGQRLVEADLARRLGTSRGPVREALKSLEVEGLVHEMPRRGFRVVHLSA